MLNEQDFAVYAKLRNLRKLISEAEGTPIYAIISNDQMAEMVTKRAVTLASLGEINGFLLCYPYPTHQQRQDSHETPLR